MKKIIFTILILLVSISVQSQDLKKWIAKYEKYCNQKVEDTIKQYGEVTYKHIPVKDNQGKILHYVISVKDTVWNAPNCPEFKEEVKTNYGFTFTSDYYVNNASLTPGVISNPIETTKPITVSRKYKCLVKRKKVVPFSADFWEYIKK